MKIMTIQIPEDAVEFVEEFVERIGGSVEEREMVSEKPRRETKKAAKEKSAKKKIDHTFMFGKWKDFDIDARKLREEAWGRKS